MKLLATRTMLVLFSMLAGLTALADDQYTPKAEDLGDGAAEADPEAKLKKLKDSRWVPVDPQAKPTNPNNALGGAAKPSGVAVTSSCTDAGGKLHKQGEAGYDPCMRSASESARAKGDKPKSDDPANADPEANAGFEMKFGG